MINTDIKRVRSVVLVEDRTLDGMQISQNVSTPSAFALFAAIGKRPGDEQRNAATGAGWFRRKEEPKIAAAEGEGHTRGPDETIWIGDMGASGFGTREWFADESNVPSGFTPIRYVLASKVDGNAAATLSAVGSRDERIKELDEMINTRNERIKELEDVIDERNDERDSLHNKIEAMHRELNSVDAETKDKPIEYRVRGACAAFRIADVLSKLWIANDQPPWRKHDKAKAIAAAWIKERTHHVYRFGAERAGAKRPKFKRGKILDRLTEVSGLLSASHAILVGGSVSEETMNKAIKKIDRAADKVDALFAKIEQG